MSKFISGGHAVRLAVLLVAVGLALSWAHIEPTSSRSEKPTSTDAPATEALVTPRPTPVPAATPIPAPAPAAAATTDQGKRQGSAHRRHARQRHHHGHARLRRAGSHRHHGHGDQRRSRRHRSDRHHAHKKHHAHERHQGHKKHHARPHRVRNHWTHHWASAGGRDISWPQCPVDVGYGGRHGLGQPLPDPGVDFVIVGLTNGRAFTPNPCLAQHLRWVRSHHVYASAYAFAAYPSRAELRRHRAHGPYDSRRFRGRLRNAGYAGARYNVRTMQRHGFTTPHVWLDIEPSSSHPWSGRRDWNAAVVRGWVRAYRDAGYTVGVYSTTSLWRGIVGRTRFGLPEWRTAGPASPRAAQSRCHDESIQGGPAVVAQWWTTSRDYDRLCPGGSRGTTLAAYFHKW